MTRTRRAMSFSSVFARVSQVAVFGFVIAVLSQAMFAQDVCPPPPHSISSPTLPTDVIPCATNGINNFDDFSWRSFVALIWPAAQGQRGVPDVNQTTFPVSVPLVFETYKSDWASFPPPNPPNPPSAPAPWQDFARGTNPGEPPLNDEWC